MPLSNFQFTEGFEVVSAFEPVDINGAAQTGDIVSLKNYEGCAIVFHGNVGSSGTDVTLTVEQMTDVSNSLSDNKALNFTRIVKKEGADLSAIGQFTIVTQAAANTFTTANNEQKEQIYVIDIKADMLDIANNFDCLRLSVNAGSAAKVCSALYILYGAKHGTDPLPSAIAD